MPYPKGNTNNLDKYVIEFKSHAMDVSAPMAKEKTD